MPARCPARATAATAHHCLAARHGGDARARRQRHAWGRGGPHPSGDAVDLFRAQRRRGDTVPPDDQRLTSGDDRCNACIGGAAEPTASGLRALAFRWDGLSGVTVAASGSTVVIPGVLRAGELVTFAAAPGEANLAVNLGVAVGGQAIVGARLGPRVQVRGAAAHNSVVPWPITLRWLAVPLALAACPPACGAMRRGLLWRARSRLGRSFTDGNQLTRLARDHATPHSPPARPQSLHTTCRIPVVVGEVLLAPAGRLTLVGFEADTGKTAEACPAGDRSIDRANTP